MQNPKEYIVQHKDRFLTELIELLKLPSVSADPASAQATHETAATVAESLRKAGCETVEICETPGYPIVYADKMIDASLPTILVWFGQQA